MRGIFKLMKQVTETYLSGLNQMASVLNCGFRFQKRVDVSWHRALQLAVRCCPVIPHVGASPRRGGELGTGKEESNHRSMSSPPVLFTHSRVALKDETHDPTSTLGSTRSFSVL